MYDVGDQVLLQTEVRDADGVLTNATMAIAVTKPDGTAASPSAPTNPSTGVYRSLVTVDQAGLWRYAWTASGAVVGVDPGQFDAAGARVYVCPLELLKRHLRLDDTDAEDDLLREVLAAVTDHFEAVVGPTTVQTFTETHYMNGGRVLIPRRFPLVTVTSWTPYQGAVIDTDRYRVDTQLGGVALRYAARGEYELVYTAGHNPWPAALREAGLLACQQEWQARNGGGGRPSPDMDAMALAPLPGTGYLLPYRALELMRPYMRELVA